VGAISAPDSAAYAAIVEASGVMTTAGGASTLSQIAAAAALEQCRDWVDAFVLHLGALRDLAVERLNAMPGVRCASPEATYLLFPDIRATGLGAEALTDYLARKARVAVIPGSPRFFGPGAAGHIRLSFATSETLLVEALDRMEGALHALAAGADPNPGRAR
jgi:bifunctional pyridoxal-dependent enzyme with beta-cystathionase and maltose regulon repressor activities